MNQNHLNEKFWDERYLSSQTGWDLGKASDPISEYTSQLEDKSISILIPGCGNAHEAQHLLDLGFQNITLIDISGTLVSQLKDRFKDKPQIKLIHGDFFEHQGQYDLVIEQTFFCAIDPSMRSQYARHMHDILKPGGKLAGLLFNCTFEKAGPPFGGNTEEYMEYFKPYFEIRKMEKAYNSVQPRSGNELFIILQKNNQS